MRYCVPMSTAFRPARPSDAAFVGWVQVVAARGHQARGWFDIVLERDEAFCVAFAAKLAVAKAKSWWHYSFVTIAEVDGAPAAAACAYPDSAPYMVSSEAMAEASDKMGLSKAEQDQLWPRGSFILSATSGEDDCWTIENVATRPEFRGRGVAQALIGHMLEGDAAARADAGADQLPDRQRTGGALLPRLRLPVRRRQDGEGLRSRDGRAGAAAAGAGVVTGSIAAP